MYIHDSCIFLAIIQFYITAFLISRFITTRVSFKAVRLKTHRVSKRPGFELERTLMITFQAGNDPMYPDVTRGGMRHQTLELRVWIEVAFLVLTQSQL